MDWTKTNWEAADKKFSQKRKVNNKVSWKMPHIIGTFYSTRMERSVEYESISEFLFYALLELDIKTIRYYIQPVEVNISYLDNTGNKKSWIHIPDVLVFRQDSIPILYQIKDPRSKESKKTEIINKACVKYAENEQWEYTVIYPKKLPERMIVNIRFLFGFLKERKNYEKWIPQLIERVKNFKSIPIGKLARSFMEEVDPLYIIPIIYHLLAKGVFYTELYKDINEFNEVILSSENQIDVFINLYGDINNENK